MSQEEINNEVQIRLAVHDEKFNSLLAKMDATNSKVDSLADEMKDFKEEMRQQNQMRAAENAEIRNEIREISKSTDAKIAEIRTTVDGMGKHVRNLTYTSIAAIAAMVITVMLNLPK